MRDDICIKSENISMFLSLETGDIYGIINCRIHFCSIS